MNFLNEAIRSKDFTSSQLLITKYLRSKLGNKVYPYPVPEVFTPAGGVKHVGVRFFIMDGTALGKIFDLAYDIDEVKNVIITVLNRAGSLSYFLRTSNGYKVTNPEGFVAINSDGDAIKLVDRLTFSQANFGGSGADKILRGWEK